MKCRHCGADLNFSLVNLGSAPPSNAYLTDKTLHGPEKWFPLRVLVCDKCWLVQTEDFSRADELFDDDYAYFSSYSKSWLTHSKGFVDEMVSRFDLTSASHVVEIASNDGYLLQYVQHLGIPCTGVEPTASTAAVSRAKGIATIEEFFGEMLADKLVSMGCAADLTAANNVLAHVPDINDFVGGFARLLKPHGVASFEFPHLLKLINESQFDTIYHEHYSYLSLTAVEHIFKENGLHVFDVEELDTHGGSLRVFAQRLDSGNRVRSARVTQQLEIELAAGVSTVDYYSNFQEKSNKVKNDLLKFLLDAKNSGVNVAAYGAAAKGNTLMNYCGIRPDLVQFVVDLNPAKQGKWMPGSRIPIYDEARLSQEKPEYVLILPWNLEKEIRAQLAYIRDWGGKFVMAVPSLRIQD
jgi:SAM-dependent methyltransferase